MVLFLARRFDSDACDEPIVLQKSLLLSTDALTSGCARVNAPWAVCASSGQQMNISVYDFSSSEQRSERVLGKIVDTVTSQQVEIKADRRYQQLMTSSSNEVHVTLYSDDVSIALEVSLLGCSSMSPPAGAWMTRDGDVMEVGCHSGSRSWTLRCENNHWVGAVGVCSASGGIINIVLNTVRCITSTSLPVCCWRYINGVYHCFASKRLALRRTCSPGDSVENEPSNGKNKLRFSDEQKLSLSKRHL